MASVSRLKRVGDAGFTQLMDSPRETGQPRYGAIKECLSFVRIAFEVGILL